MNNRNLSRRERVKRGRSLKKLVGKDVLVKVYSSHVDSEILRGELKNFQGEKIQGYFVKDVQVPTNYTTIDAMPGQIPRILVEITNENYKFPVMRRAI